MGNIREKTELYQKMATEQARWEKHRKLEGEVLDLRTENEKLKKRFCEFADTCPTRINKLQERNNGTNN